MPQARHGGNGVWALAVVGSKFDGTGLEKVQMGQTQVALFAGAGSDGGRWKGLSVRRAGEAVALLEGGDNPAACLFCVDNRVEGFGTNVILAEDFKNPA
jgi:hypothetical protein